MAKVAVCFGAVAYWAWAEPGWRPARRVGNSSPGEQASGLALVKLSRRPPEG